MLRKLTALGVVGLAAHTTAVQAMDFDPAVFTVNGFGTLGAVYSSEDQATYSGPGFNVRGAGANDRVSTDVDSRLGLQVLGKFTDQLTATVQIISEQNYDGSYAPHAEWANLKYQLTPDLAVRLGRTAMPSFLFSDSRKVGYAIPWVRAPHEVYDLLPITNSDGVDLSYKVQTGSVGHTLQAIYGENVADIAPGFKGKAKHVWGIFDTIAFGDFTAKITYQEQKLYFGSYKLPNIYGQTKAADTSFMVLGAHYDPGLFFIGAEWAHVKIEDPIFFRDTSAWYLSGGYRFGELTPYVTVAEQKPKDPPMFGYSLEQRSYAIGARWDFMSKFNLKAEYQYADLPANSQGQLDVPQILIDLPPFGPIPVPSPSYTPGENYSLISLQINFVF